MLAASLPDHAGRAGISQPSGLRDKLKAATASVHRELDARFGALDMTSIQGYRRFLEASAAALLPLETALERSGIAELFADWPQRSRRGAIAADLLRLGGAANSLPPLAAMGRQEMWGAMYVLEGSRLGARYLLRKVAGCGESQIAAATSYLQHGSGQPPWPTFLEKLEDEKVTPDDEARMISGARQAFAMFSRAAET